MQCVYFLSAKATMMSKSRGVTKRCLSWLTSNMSPNAGGGGWGVQLYTGAQIHFGDLTPYLTYAKSFSHPIDLLEGLTDTFG